jgi:large subunit ribosomal protein L31e
MERTYTIPLRKGTMLTARTRRAKKAINVLKEYLVRHLKTDQIHLSNALNEHIWQNGMRNPIMKVTVTAVKDDKGVAKVRLATEAAESNAKAEKKAQKPTADDKKNAVIADAKPAEAAAEKPKATDKAEKPKKAAKAAQ